MSWDTTLEFLRRCASDGITNLLLGATLLFLTRLLFARHLESRRIRVVGRALDRSQIWHEVKNSLVVTTFSAFQVLVLLHLEGLGRVELPGGLGPHGWAGMLGVVVGLLVFNDLWFYGVHRLLHTPWLYRRVHSVHHRSLDVNPMTSYSFHLVEAVLLTGWLIPVAMALPLPFVALMIAQVLGLLNNFMAHLGFELLPLRWTQWPVLRWTNTATFHSMHHQHFRGNFGLQTRFWDRLFGTELPGYEEAFAASHGIGRDA